MYDILLCHLSNHRKNWHQEINGGFENKMASHVTSHVKFRKYVCDRIYFSGI